MTRIVIDALHGEPVRVTRFAMERKNDDGGYRRAEGWLVPERSYSVRTDRVLAPQGAGALGRSSFLGPDPQGAERPDGAQGVGSEKGNRGAEIQRSDRDMRALFS